MTKSIVKKTRANILTHNFKFILIAILVMNILMLAASVFPKINSMLSLVPLMPERLYGIFTSPFIHASWGHLTGNIVGLLISGYLASLQPHFKRATVFIMVFTGGLVWLFAEQGNHLGASGIVMGYYGFLLGTAIFTRNLIGIISFAALIAVTYYANISFFATLFDFSAQTSSSSHIFGFVSGLVGAYIFRVKSK